MGTLHVTLGFILKDQFNVDIVKGESNLRDQLGSNSTLRNTRLRITSKHIVTEPIHFSVRYDRFGIGHPFATILAF